MKMLIKGYTSVWHLLTSTEKIIHECLGSAELKHTLTWIASPLATFVWFLPYLECLPFPLHWAMVLAIWEAHSPPSFQASLSIRNSSCSSMSSLPGLALLIPEILYKKGFHELSYFTFKNWKYNVITFQFPFPSPKPFHIVVWTFFSRGDTTYMYIHSPQIGSPWHTKFIQIHDIPKFATIKVQLGESVSSIGCTQKWFTDSCITKAHFRMGNSSQKLQTRSILHSL